MSDVFISYSRKDIAYARLLQTSLRESGIETWIDWDRIPIGEKWWDEITTAIESANVFLFIISGSSMTSDVCGKEIQLALQNHKRVIPIIIDDLSPEQIKKLAPELPDINWVVFQRDHLFHLKNLHGAEGEPVAVPKLPEFDEALRKLSEAIHTDWEWVKAHTQLQVGALRWQAAGYDSAYTLRGKALEEAERALITAVAKLPSVSPIQIEFVARSRDHENAEQQKQLALERRARQRQRFALWAIGVGLVTAIILGAAAWGQRNQYLGETIVRATAQAVAEEQRGIAEDQSQIALEQKGIAEEQRQTAEAERDQAVARRLAAEGRTLASQRYDLALLMGVEAVTRSAPEVWAYQDLFQIIQASPRLLAFARGHSADVFAVSAHPTKPMVVTAGNDGAFILWDVSDPATPTMVGAPTTRSNIAIRSAAFSPDGSRLAIGSFDGAIELFDITSPDSPKVITRPTSPHTKSVNALTYSPDGSMLASGAEDGTMQLWQASDPSTLTPIGEPLKWNFGGVLSLSFSPDGSLLAPTCFNKFITDIFFWDLTDPAAPVLISNPKTAQTDSIAFHPSQPVVAVGSMDGEISLWNITDPSAPIKITSVKGNTFTQILSLRFTSEGEKLIAATSEKELKMFDTSQPSQLIEVGGPMVGHTERITQLALSPDGSLAYSVSWDDNLIIWDIDDDRVPTRIGSRAVLENSNDHAAPHPTQPWVADGSDNQTLRLWVVSDPSQPRILSEAPLASGNVLDISFSPNGELLAVAEVGNKIEIFSVSSDGSLQNYASPLMGHTTFIERVEFSPNGELLVSSDFGYHTTLWQLLDGKVRPVGLPIDGIRVSFSADGFRMAVAGDDTLELWDLKTPTDPTRMGVYKHSERMVILGIAYHSRAPIVYGAGSDGQLYVFDVADPSQPTLIPPVITAGNNFIYDVALSADGSTLALATGDNEVSFWDVISANTPAYIGAYGGLANSLNRVKFQSDGSRLLTTGGANETILWNMPPQQTLPELACGLSGRNFTRSEWTAIFSGNEVYRTSCP